MTHAPLMLQTWGHKEWNNEGERQRCFIFEASAVTAVSKADTPINYKHSRSHTNTCPNKDFTNKI